MVVEFCGERRINPRRTGFTEAKSMGVSANEGIRIGEVRDDGVLHWIWIMFVMGCDYRFGW